jgi:carbon starvation protein
MQKSVDAAGKPIPVWQLFWSLFGASNQLLAALTLLGVTVWLWRTRRAMWVWLVTGIPTVLMYVMSLWALARIIHVNSARDILLARILGASDAANASLNLVVWIAILLVLLAAWMLVEAVLVFVRFDDRPSPPQYQPEPA